MNVDGVKSRPGLNGFLVLFKGKDAGHRVAPILDKPQLRHERLYDLPRASQ